jgi:hypothetical protein
MRAICPGTASRFSPSRESYARQKIVDGDLARVAAIARQVASVRVQDAKRISLL